MTNLTALISYSLISDESITVSFGASIDRKKNSAGDILQEDRITSV